MTLFCDIIVIGLILEKVLISKDNYLNLLKLLIKKTKQPYGYVFTLIRNSRATVEYIGFLGQT